jgi:serine/threonine-protein kinase RsbW
VNQPLENLAAIDVVDLRIPCKAEWVQIARLSVGGVASRLNFSIDDIQDIKIAVAEACTNAIQFAEGSPYIEIKCEAIGRQLRLTIRDFGRGPHPVDGLGIFLIRALMDEVEYQAHPEGGTLLVMVKRPVN